MQLTLQNAKFGVCMDLIWNCVGLARIRVCVSLIHRLTVSKALCTKLLFIDDFLDKVCDWIYDLGPFLPQRLALTPHYPVL